MQYSAKFLDRIRGINFLATASPTHDHTLLFGKLRKKMVHTGEDVAFACSLHSGLYSQIDWLKHIQVNGSHTDPKTHLPYVKVLQVIKTAVVSMELTTKALCAG